MARKLLVSEKTLELNVTSAILQAIRKVPGAERAIWIGFTQAQEDRYGLDERLSNLPNGMYLALQFKAPARRSPDRAPYGFAIGMQQNAKLLQLAQRRPSGVYYILPHYNTFKRLRAFAPNLLTHSYGLRVDDTRTLPCTHGGYHRVESWERTPTDTPHADIYSQHHRAETVSLLELFSSGDVDRAGLAERAHALPLTRDGLLSRAHVVSWIRDLLSEEEHPAVVGQELRGFRLLVLPPSR